MRFAIIYTACATDNHESIEQFAPLHLNQPDVWEQWGWDEVADWDTWGEYGVGGEWIAILSREQFEELLRERGLQVKDEEVLVEGMPGFGNDKVRAIPFEVRGVDWEVKALVTPIAESWHSGRSEFSERDWGRIKNIVVKHYQATGV